MAVSLAYDDTLSRVRLTAGGLPSAAVSVRVERSTDQVRWTTVRGGAALLPSDLAVALDDWEFAPGRVNYYRVTSYASGGSQVGQQHGSMTPVIDRVWLKSVARPFLNQKVVVQDYGPVSRPARGGVFEVIGRTLPVAVQEVRGSREWTMTVLTDGEGEAHDLDLLLASGDILLVQVPADCDVPGGYVTVGTAQAARPSRRSRRRLWDLPCTEVAAPGADVVGATVNYQSLQATYATYADQLAAHATYGSLLELIGDPEDVIVP